MVWYDSLELIKTGLLGLLGFTTRAALALVYLQTRNTAVKTILLNKKWLLGLFGLLTKLVYVFRVIPVIMFIKL